MKFLHFGRTCGREWLVERQLGDRQCVIHGDAEGKYGNCCSLAAVIGDEL